MSSIHILTVLAACRTQVVQQCLSVLVLVLSPQLLLVLRAYVFYGKGFFFGGGGGGCAKVILRNKQLACSVKTTNILHDCCILILLCVRVRVCVCVCVCVCACAHAHARKKERGRERESVYVHACMQWCCWICPIDGVVFSAIQPWSRRSLFC